MIERSSVTSTAPYTLAWGYSRAVRIGRHIEVSGTSATFDDGSVHAPGDPYEQTRFIFRIIEEALTELGASLGDVVRTRAFLTRGNDWQEVGRAHLDVLGEIAPTSTCIAGVELLNDDLVVEIEVAAIVAGEEIA